MHQKLLFNNKQAFTLVDVLITLGVIGIIAALIIPVLIKGAENNAYVSGTIKYQSILQSAVKQYMADNNYNDLIQADIFNNGGGFTQAGTLRVWNAFKNYFKVTKDCGVNTNQGCFPSNIRQINNNYPTSSDDKNPDSSTLAGKGILDDGTTIFFADYPNNCSYDRSISHTGELTATCGYVRIDVNGMTPPNQYGRDNYLFWILPNSKVLPGGTSDDHLKGCNPTSTDVTADGNGAAGIGIGCTYNVIINKAMNY